MNQKLSSYLTKQNFINFGIVSGFIYVINVILWKVAITNFYGWFVPDFDWFFYIRYFNPLSIINAIFFAFSGDTLPYLSSFSLRSFLYLLDNHIHFISLISFLFGLCINFIIGIKFSDTISKVFKLTGSQTKGSETNGSETNGSEIKVVEDQTMSVGDWLKTLLIMIVPIANLVMIIVWGFGGNTPETKANWAKAVLIFMVISIVLNILFFGALIGTLLKQLFSL